MGGGGSDPGEPARPHAAGGSVCGSQAEAGLGPAGGRGAPGPAAAPPLCHGTAQVGIIQP